MKILAGNYLTNSSFIPIGFTPAAYGDRPMAIAVGSYTTYSGIIGIAQQSRLIYIARLGAELGTGNYAPSCEIRFLTNDAIPTTLPWNAS